MINTNAAISAKSAGHVYLTLADGTTNSLSDSALFSKVDLTINGKGTLNVDGKKNNGIKVNDTLHITGGTYNITAVGDAFNVNDELNITGTTMTIDAKEEDLLKINSEIHLIGVDSDLHYPAFEIRNSYDFLKNNDKNVYHHEIKSIHGHDAFLMEYEQLNEILGKII